MAKKYRLEYLPLFERELADTVDYIAKTLQNPIAAERLTDDTEKAILERLKAPASFQKYNSIKDRKNPYYTIYVKNYTVFYVVIDDVMEVRRFVYGKRDIEKIV